MITKIGLRICTDDYKLTNYYLFCRDTNQAVLIDRAFVSFANRNSPTIDCFAPPALNLNTSQSLQATICTLCYNAQVCILTPDFIDTNRFLDGITYQAGNTFSTNPTSLTVTYQCIGLLKSNKDCVFFVQII